MRSDPPPEMIQGSIVRRLLGMTAPMIVGYLAVIAFEFADVWFVSRLGTVPLAAISFVFPITLVVICVFVGLGIGTGSVVSRAVGKGDMASARRLASDSLILGILLALVLSVIGISSMDWLFSLLGAPEEIMGDIRDYMLIWYAGIITLAVPLVAGNSLLAIGDARATGLINTVGSLVNIALDPLLIFGFFIIPGWGMTGAALATVGARIISSCLGLYLMIGRRRLFVFHPLKLSMTFRSWVQVISIGLPASFLHISGPLALGILTRLAAGFGLEAVAAVGVGSRIDPFILLVFWALSDVMVVFTGQNYGRRNLKRIHRALFISWGWCLGFGGLCFFPLFFGGVGVGKLFSSETAVIGTIAEYFRVMPLSYGFVGVIYVTGAVFNGLGRPIRGAMISVIHLLVFLLPLSLWGGRLGGLSGIFIGFASASVLGALLGAIWIHKVVKRLSVLEN